MSAPTNPSEDFKEVNDVAVCPHRCRAAQCGHKTVNRMNDFRGICHNCRRTCQIRFNCGEWVAG